MLIKAYTILKRDFLLDYAEKILHLECAIKRLCLYYANQSIDYASVYT